MAHWAKHAPFGEVDSDWVAWFVEKYIDRREMHDIRQMLEAIRDRYRSRSGTAAAQAVE